jgi:hypothetical protein
MAVEIFQVTLEPQGASITAACLDYPQPGPVDGYGFEAFGWVVSDAGITDVEFVHDGVVVASCELTVSRPDVAGIYGGSSHVGFWQALGTVGLAPEFTLWVRAVFRDGHREMFAMIRGAQQLTAAFDASSQPIMVNALGRSGGALLMRMLAEHPDVIVEQRFPYETRVLSYWMHFLRVLAAPVDAAQDAPFWSDPNRLPPFPYFSLNPTAGAIPPEQPTLDRWYGVDQVEELARVAQAAVESFYREYAGARNRALPPFFGEIMVPAGHCRWTAKLLYPRAREVFLVRDPRDILASVLAFTARRGVAYPGHEWVGSDEQYVGSIRVYLSEFADWWKRRSRYSSLVRYEDLVRSPTETLGAMLAALELDSSPRIVDSLVAAGNHVSGDVTAHRTSPDGPSSIGRWERDLDLRLKALCDKAFDGLLDELGGGGS